MSIGVRRRLISRRLFGQPANVPCGSKAASTGARKGLPVRDDAAADAKRRALLDRMKKAASRPEEEA